MIREANVSLPSPLLGRGAGGEGESTYDRSLQLPLFPKGRGFFTGREGQSQRKAGGQLPLTPDPSPQRGEGRVVTATPVFKNLTQRIAFRNQRIQRRSRPNPLPENLISNFKCFIFPLPAPICVCGEAALGSKKSHA